MSIDIVNLIESNPITKFNGNYQSKLVEKVKNNFSNYEQQMFLSSFYCYLKYDSKTDFVIDLDNVWNWVGFNQKVKAKILLENHFISNKDYKKLLSPTGKQSTHVKGGHNKEIFMLNVETFKKFCLKAGTKKADEIHDYFIKLENIMFEITKEESEELKQQLQQLEDKKNHEYQINLARQKILEREKVLLKEYAQSGAIVYIIKVKSYDNGQYIVKIGHSTKGIQSRYNEHKNKYEECLLMDCFFVDKSKDFESFIHNHENIRLNKVTNLIGHENENELFLIGKELTYQMILNVIDNNIKNYNLCVNELVKENELLKYQIQTNQYNINNELLTQMMKTIQVLNIKIDNLEKSNQEIICKFNTSQTKVATGFSQQMPHLGPRLQKINPENLQLIKVYESVTEAMNEDKNIKRPSITKAVEENTIYCGFRWLLVERNLDPQIIHTIEPTKITKTQNLGYIAKLNSTKTEILNVYLDRKTAATLNGYNSNSGLDNVVKNKTLSNGFYYLLYDECDEDLKYEFINKNNNNEPLLYKNGVGQYDVNNNIIREFSCKYDCIRTLSISDKTLTKALEKNIMYNGYYYKMIGEKLSCL
jgi:hypothetical protein